MLTTLQFLQIDNEARFQKPTIHHSIGQLYFTWTNIYICPPDFKLAITGKQKTKRGRRKTLSDLFFFTFTYFKGHPVFDCVHPVVGCAVTTSGPVDQRPSTVFDIQETFVRGVTWMSKHFIHVYKRKTWFAHCYSEAITCGTCLHSRTKKTQKQISLILVIHCFFY